jgi:ATP-dependent Clp protease adaptor protein ClpS
MDGERTSIIDLMTELKTAETAQPYALVVHNDDQTPMDFVTGLFFDYCDMQREEARKAMLEIHEQGSIRLFKAKKEAIEAVANLFEKLAREKGYPLKCTVCRI